MDEAGFVCGIPDPSLSMPRPDGAADRCHCDALAVLITSVVDTCVCLNMAKTSGVVELSRNAPPGSLRVPP